MKISIQSINQLTILIMLCFSMIRVLYYLCITTYNNKYHTRPLINYYKQQNNTQQKHSFKYENLVTYIYIMTK